jgi:hypothetical protein
MNNTQELLDIVKIDLPSISCNQVDPCPYKERSVSYATGVVIPEPGLDPEEIFKECCYIHNVFADANSSQDFKNDYSSFYHQKQLNNESVSFVLLHMEFDTEYQLNNGTFGQFFGFGSFPENINLTGYLVEWKKVLAEIGPGSFKVIKRVNIAGVDVEMNSIVFTLSQFTSRKADHTVRIDVVMNGRLIKTGVDFTGTGWKHSIRVPGFFGRREPGIEEDNLIKRTYEKKQISARQTNEYKFQTNLIPDCLTNEIWDFILLSNDIYFNDYNLNNHSYDFIKFGAKFASNDGTDYSPNTRKARLNLTFNDKFENNIKRNFS